MAVAPLIRNNQSQLIRLPSGQIVPLDSITGALPPAPAAASGPGSGPDTVSAGQSSNALPLASGPPQQLVSPNGRGGAAHQDKIPTGGADEFKVIQAPEDDNSGIAALVKGLGKAAGKSAAPSAPGTPGNTGAGFMDKIKNFLGLDGANGAGDGMTGATVPPRAPVEKNELPPIPEPLSAGAMPAPAPAPATAAVIPPPGQPQDKPGLMQRLGSALGINSTPSAAPSAAAPAAAIPPPAPAPTPGKDQNALTIDPATGKAVFNENYDRPAPLPAPEPAAALDPIRKPTGGFLDGIIDHGNEIGPTEEQVIQNRTGGSYKPDTWFDRLNANPARMALLTGGLATMAAASKPGARWTGAIGEGALSGIKTVYERDAAAKEQGLAQQKQDLEGRKEDSQAQLRKDQGAFYNVRGDALGQNADANTVKADAARVTADARAKFGFGKSGNGKDSVFKEKQTAWLAAHPGDDTGALDYASGHRKLGGAETLRSAYAIANSENNAALTPQGPEWVDKRASEIAARIGANNEASGGGGGGGAVPAPKNAAAPAKSGGAVPPKVGTVVNGYTFQGGNPNDPKAWKK